jgi:hypothetical protein
MHVIRMCDGLQNNSRIKPETSPNNEKNGIPLEERKTHKRQ